MYRGKSSLIEPVGCIGLVAGCLVALSSAGTLTVPGQYPTIQAAIDAAVDGDVVLVANGTYTGLGNRDIDFGGKAITVRSAHGPAACIIDCQASEGDLHRAFNFHSGETHSSVVEGFTIQNGVQLGGGAVRCQPAAPVIRNCLFRNNRSTANGGAIRAVDAVGAGPNLVDCVFIDNVAATGGGGASFDRCGPFSVTNCTFRQNSTTSPDVRGGGAMGINQCGPATFADCQFIENQTARIGGALWVTAGSAAIENCMFIGNYAFNGGTLAVSLDASATVSNCLFAGNEAEDDERPAAALWVGDGFGGPSQAAVVNCTFSENVSHPSGGALVVTQTSHADVANCVFWGDSPAGIALTETATITVSYSDVQGGWSGTGNIDVDPLFTDPGQDNFRLSPGSPGIDSGDPTWVPLPGEVDLDGHLRLWDGDGNAAAIVDMGAYEFASHPYGDLNCDGRIDFRDVGPFVLAVLNPDRYRATYPGCNILTGDINGDGLVNLDDVGPFFDLLKGCR